MDLVRLSKTMSYVLRHAPWEYELELDDEGWVPVEQLLDGLREQPAFRNIQIQDLQSVIKTSSKSRFEISGEDIRALYGHSIPGKLVKKPGQPPAILYHGTQRRFLSKISTEGLRPMSRQYVHLSVDTHMANTVGSRRGSDTVILQIRAAEAAKQGLTFYEGNAQVWLADNVPPAWIIFP
jgi:putative RNA 2'-phosphotransferase